MADLDITHQGNAHYIAVIAAHSAKQVAYKAGNGSASAIKTADITFHRAVVASAKANGVGFAVNMQALRELGTGGE
jgi:hypothetical protein